MLNICRGVSKLKFDVKKQILIIPLIICENDPTIAAVENNPGAHFWEPPIYIIDIYEENVIFFGYLNFIKTGTLCMQILEHINGIIFSKSTKISVLYSVGIYLFLFVLQFSDTTQRTPLFAYNIRVIYRLLRCCFQE